MINKNKYHPKHLKVFTKDGRIEKIKDKFDIDLNLKNIIGKNYNDVFTKIKLPNILDLTEDEILKFNNSNFDVKYSYYLLIDESINNEFVEYDFINISSTINAAEQAFINKEEELESIIDLVPGVLYWKDKKGNYLKTNNSLLSSGASTKTLVNKNDKELWPEKVETLSKNDALILAGEEKTFEETTVENGEIRYYIARKKPHRNFYGEIIGIIGLSIDVTDKKLMEKKIEQQNQELKKKDAIKTQFIENFSHDIKVPINALIGRTQLLKLIGRKEKNEKIMRAAEDADNSAMVLDTLFTQMRDIVIHEQFDKKIYNTNFNLSNLVEKEVKIAKMSILNNKEVSIHFSAAENLSIDVNSDYYKLSQIIRNLLSNAVKFTDKGNIDIETEVVEKDSNQIGFKFKVSDTGIGIDGNHQNNIFEMFNRAGITSHDTNRHGMGVGLYIVKNNINILGGSVTFESYLEQGSKFFINIPLETV